MSSTNEVSPNFFPLVLVLTAIVVFAVFIFPSFGNVSTQLTEDQSSDVGDLPEANPTEVANAVPSEIPVTPTPIEEDLSLTDEPTSDTDSPSEPLVAIDALGIFSTDEATPSNTDDSTEDEKPFVAIDALNIFGDNETPEADESTEVVGDTSETTSTPISPTPTVVEEATATPTLQPTLEPTEEAVETEGPANTTSDVVGTSNVVEYTLGTQSGGDPAMAFIGMGGDIDGQVNPVLFANVGDTVRITLINSDFQAHDLTIDEFSVTTGQLTTQGQEAVVEFTITEAGAYTYYCSIPGHRTLGMEGIIGVTG